MPPATKATPRSNGSRLIRKRLVGARGACVRRSVSTLPDWLPAPVFFREPEFFDDLQRIVLPHIVEGLAPGEPLRVWVPGCSTGEEVYSLAIAFREYQGVRAIPPTIRIVGTEFSDFYLRFARSATYPEASVEGLSVERLRRFFVRVPGGYRIGRKIRECCEFGRHNLLLKFPSGHLDLISCRNVASHPLPALARKYVSIFQRVLKPSGLVLLGNQPTDQAAAPKYLVSQGGALVPAQSHDGAEVKVGAKELKNLYARLLRAADEEGKKIARDLHDSFGPVLARVLMEVSELADQLSSQPDVARRLQGLREELSDVAKGVHDLSHALHPAVLSQLGIAAALESECAAASRRWGMSIKFSAEDVPEMLPEALALCLYRVAQECLENIRKHARTSRAWVALQRRGRTVMMTIRDYGVGFDLKEAHEKGGLGLVNMEERVRLVNGTLHVNSEPCIGTRVEVRVALP